MDFSYTLLQNSYFPGFSDAFRWIFRTLFCRMLHFLGFSNDFRWIFRTLFCRFSNFLKDVQMIWYGFFVHCFAECSIFLGFSDDFRWIFRTLFCTIFNFPWFSDDFRWIFSYTVLQNDTFVQDLQMILDGFSVHCFAQWSISRIFRWF